MFKLLEINASMKFVGQAASRGVCNAINFFLISTASNIIRNRTAGVPEPTAFDPNPVNHIDNYDEAKKDAEDKTNTDENREEQGYEAPEDPTVVAGYLKVIYAELNEELIRHAQKVEYQSSPGHFYPNPFEIPMSLSKEIERQMKAVKLPSEALLRNEAEILGRPYEEIVAAAQRKMVQRVGFIRENAKEIIELASNWHLSGDDADIEYEDAYERLHPMMKLRLLAGAEQGVFFAIGNQIENRQRLDLKTVKGNIKLLEDTQEAIHDEVDRLMRIDSFKRKVHEAEERNQQYPRFNMRPSELKKMLEEEAKKQKKA
jgi:hypothetical protein